MGSPRFKRTAETCERRDWRIRDPTWRKRDPTWRKSDEIGEKVNFVGEKNLFVRLPLVVIVLPVLVPSLRCLLVRSTTRCTRRGWYRRSQGLSKGIPWAACYLDSQAQKGGMGLLYGMLYSIICYKACYMETFIQPAI